jgi:hypothetical protein
MTDTLNLSLEIGENYNSSVCHCCGQKSNVGHGFIYKNDDAYAVYYAGWSLNHADKKVSFAIAIGEWDDNSTNSNRTCFGIEVFEEKNRFLFTIVEPIKSPWSNTGLLGRMLPRCDALAHPCLNEVFHLVEYVIHNHTAIQEYLS